MVMQAKKYYKKRMKRGFRKKRKEKK